MFSCRTPVFPFRSLIERRIIEETQNDNSAGIIAYVFFRLLTPLVSPKWAFQGRSEKYTATPEGALRVFLKCDMEP